MSFREIEIKHSYETLVEDPVKDFYVPVLKQAVSYDRIAGFFSSTSLALAARGIAGLISNGGHMRLIVSPKLNKEDAEIIRLAGDDPQSIIETIMIRDFRDVENRLVEDHVKALGWMLAEGHLEMRIACIVNENEVDSGALFHQKVGILKDADGNEMSFSGSINETASGWLTNSEEFKVFCSWDDGHKYFQEDKKKFDEFWHGQRKHTKIFSPSESFRYQLIKIGEDFKPDSLVLSRYVKERKIQEAKTAIPLFFYQKDAVEAWEKAQGRLLFEMATGTGKTRTAIACVNQLLASEEKLVCVVAAPEITLARQWEGELKNLNVCFDDVVYADSSSGGKAKWLPILKRCISRIAIRRSKSLLIITTHDTACSDEFCSTISSITPNVKTCLVGDEVHGLGARIRQRALLDRYDYRIGLSATPARWFDESGTIALRSFFGNDSYKFTIKDAQNTINPLTGETFLTPYRYRPIFVSLDESEMAEYARLSERIVKLSHSEDQDNLDLRDRLLMKRADIAKNAKSKMPAFEKLVEQEGADRTLVFTSPQQIEYVCRLLASHRIAAHPFTMNQGTRKSPEYGGLSEREFLIKSFKEDSYQALVAITCLDEGIDIPCAEKAILLSNSTNPREYIQRIGRVIRRYPGKEKADIVDFVVEPDFSCFTDPESRLIEIRLFEKELHRVEEMAANAMNSTEVLFAVNDRLERVYGLQ